MIKNLIQFCLANFNLRLIKLENEFSNKIPVEADIEEKKLIELTKKYSMNGSLRIWTLIIALKKISENNIEGDFVETGVWKGGNLILMRKYMQKYCLIDRNIFGYDTFEGMPEPTKNDKDFKNINATKYFSDKTNLENFKSFNSKISLDEVKNNFVRITGDSNNLKLIKGKTQETLKNENNLPNKIAILRLNTCFYESTKFELQILYDKLQKGGYLIIDDYGYWKGAKLAVDEFFKNKKKYFHFVDHTCRFLIKD
ncbi:TylF/MycF/NovP-related O-methyltransferase [Candidatus Pelagibacter sp. HIMB1542]|uniref:TylF/MycF/NovP-related O-methyltransferase n=1 Tax=Candidatus Pelagibacter sp. HIMB1542 TaxID=3413346 RepID=UPI003F827A9A